MEVSKALYTFYIGGFPLELKPEAIIQLVVVLLIGALAIWSTRDLKRKPESRKQLVVEYIYTTIQNLVDSNMGEEYRSVIPFIGTIAAFILPMNLLGLIGIEPTTKQYSVALGLGLISFLVIQGYAINKHGVKEYFIGYGHPMIFMLPLNIIERIMLPVSLSLRLFGNVLAASFIVELVYKGLSKIAWIAQIGLPVPLHAYFDVFDGTIQMVIFVMLTMINIKVIAEH